jgi:hypothetical protein
MRKIDTRNGPSNARGLMNLVHVDEDGREDYEDAFHVARNRLISCGRLVVALDRELAMCEHWTAAICRQTEHNYVDLDRADWPDHARLIHAWALSANQSATAARRKVAERYREEGDR